MALTEILTLPVLGAVIELRPAGLDDTYAAVALVDVPDGMEASQPLRVQYQMRVDDLELLHQVQSVDGEPVKDVLALKSLLDPEDIGAMRKAAEALKKKKRLASVSSPAAESSKPA